jgi:hydroxymethylglutaryl-CoA reductase
MTLSHVVSKIANFCVEVLTDCCTNKIGTQKHTLGVSMDLLVLRYEYMIGYTLKENSKEGKIRLEPKMWCL